MVLTTVGISETRGRQVLNYKYMYKLIKDKISGSIASVKRDIDNAYIPFDPANTDYQAYLKWVSEGNTPLPPDQE